MTINVVVDTNWGSATEFDLVTYFGNSDFDAPTTIRTANSIRVETTSLVAGVDVDVVLIGTGFSYDVSGALTSGVITTIQLRARTGDLLITAASGYAVDAAVLYDAAATGNSAVLTQLLFDADGFNFVGGADSDTFVAGNAGSLLLGGAGADTLTGGDGVDTASYADSIAAVSIDLFFGTGTDGDAQGDTLTNIENVVGSSGDDSLIGNQASNTLTGGVGADSLDGGDGGDTASYAGSNGPVTVSLLDGTAAGGHAAGDILTNIEGLVGSDGADVLTGDDADNVIEGGKGADTLTGNGGFDIASYAGSVAGVTLLLGANGTQTLGTGIGSDALGDKVAGFEGIVGGGGNDALTGNEVANYLEGGAGNDTLKGNAGDDRLAGGLGIDVLDGGTGNDVLAGGVNDALTGGDGSDTATFADSADDITVALSLNGAASFGIGGSAQGAKLTFVENLIGGSGNDVLTGNNLVNVIEGGDGDDTLEGGVNPANAGDTVSYASSSGPVFVDLSNTGVQVTVSAGNDKLTGFENLVGSSQSDVLTGDANANVIEGGGGADTIDGGGGLDTASYSTSKAGVTVDLQIVSLPQISVGTDADGDELTNIENIVGSAFDDVLTGNPADNVVNSIKAGAGNDIVAGLGNNDVFDGEGGIDTISFLGTTDPITVVLTSANVIAAVKTTLAAPAGQILNFENIVGGDGDDVLTGNTMDNVIDGGFGTNKLDGGTGNDTLSYASRVNDLSLVLSAVNPATGFATFGVDSVRGFESIVGGAGNDIISGDGLNNIIDGGAGNDTLDGMGGLNTVSYASSQNDVTVTVGDNGAQTTSNGGVGDDDKLSNFQNILGGAHNDTLNGNIGINVIKGAGGNDTIEGRGGNDTLEGEGGNDSLEGGVGTDTLIGGAGSDTAVYANSATGVTIVLGKDGALATGTGAGSEALGDKLTFIENITGSAAADTLTGNNLVNKLSGLADNDLIQGGLGADVLDGGADTDTISYLSSAAGVTVVLNGATATIGKGGDAEGDSIVNFENVIGSTKDDVIVGDSNVNVLDGGAGLLDTLSYQNDTTGVVIALAAKGALQTLTGAGGDAEGDKISNFENLVGGLGADTLTGNELSNIIDGGAGADALEGGAGLDTLSYDRSGDGNSDGNGVTVLLNGSPGAGEDADGDVFSGFENLTGSAFHDTLGGNALVNIIKGGAGNDIVKGDTGADTLEGGSGIDTVDYSANADGAKSFTIMLGAPGAQTAVTGTDLNAAGDKVRDFENVRGGAGKDKITGSLLANVLDGGGNDDILDGGAGADTLIGGSGNDVYIVDNAGDVVQEGALEGILDAVQASVSYAITAGQYVEKLVLTGVAAIDGKGNELDNQIIGNGAANVIEGGAGNDALDGGAGNDTLSYAGDSLGVTVTLNGAGLADLSGNTSSGNDADGDSAIRFEHLRGGSGADILTGDDGANIIEGGGGADILDGGGNPATAGDTVSYANSAFGVTADLATGGADGGDAAGDTISGFENIIGSNASDVLTGSDGANRIEGDIGNDILSGGKGNDTLLGGAGSDTISGGAGKDILDGGAGNDTLSYSDSTAGVGVTISFGALTTTGAGLAGSDALGDMITGFENAVGTNYSDTLQGGIGSNLLMGLDGNDKLDGGAGNDTLIGGSGDDTYVVDSAADVVVENVGEGDDTIQTSFSYALGGADVENLTLMGTGAINATGNSIANKITGNAGANILIGGGGGDYLDGGLGNDTASYADETSGLTVNLANGTGAGGAAEGDILINIENVTGGSGNDTLIGDKFINLLEGGDGDDALIGNGLGDKLFGGAGSDTASYANSSAGVTVSLELNDGVKVQVSTGDAGGDTFKSIENVIGSVQNDKLTGDASANTLTGGDGDDVLSGGGGLDTLIGGAGSDTYIVGDLGVVITENTDEGIDTIQSSKSVNALAANVENLVLTGGAEIGNGNALDNIITGDETDNTLDGKDGNDTLIGGKGNDTLTGGAGNDIIVYKTGDGSDIVKDFKASNGTADRINLLGVASIASFAGIQAITTDDGLGNTVINFGGTNKITLEGVLEADLGANDFIFNDTATNQAPNDIALSNANLKSNAAVGSVVGTLTATDPDVGSVFKFALESDANGLFSVAGNQLKVNSPLTAGAYDVIVKVTDQTNLSYSETFTVTVSQAVTESGGGAGNDTLTGTPGVDTLSGLAGDDTLIGLGNGDTLNGGLGFDTVNYFSMAQGVSVTLTPGYVSNGITVTNTGDAAGDVFIGIEAIRGTRFNDHLVGNDTNNNLNGGPGADILDGGPGDFVADAATSNDASAGLTVSLADPSKNTGEALGDVFISIERLRGSAFNDFLEGDSKNNRLEGFTGADKLDGLAGFDYAGYLLSATGVTVSLANPALNTGDAKGDVFSNIEGLWGSNFNDKLIGDANPNQFVGMTGADIFDGAGGDDQVNYFSAAFIGTAGVVASLANPALNTGDAAGDSYFNIEALAGTIYADTLIGDENANFLFGDTGDDTLVGGSGKDSGDGADTFSGGNVIVGVSAGGNGYDTVSYAAATVGFTASLVDQKANTGAAAGDIYISIEILRGGAGDDTLIGFTTTNSWLHGGSGADQLVGGTAKDAATYNFSAAGLTVSLLNPSLNTGEAKGDTYTSIERLRGSNFDDFLQGDASNNDIEGGAGNDTIDGGAGFDYVRYINASSAVTVSFLDPTKNTGDAKGDVYLSIEGLWGSHYDDTLIGSNANDTIHGSEGGDMIDGGQGIDTAAYFAPGEWLFNFGFTIDLADSTKNTGDAKGDTYTSIENLNGTHLGDWLYGDGSNNLLDGGGGDDLIVGRGGDDQLLGGGGFDVASYRDASAEITVDLSNLASNTGDAAGDTYTSIEAIEGTAFDDVLKGAGASDTFIGGGGKDDLQGGGGSDTASYQFSTAAVTASLAAPASNTGDADDDTYDSIENLTGSRFADWLFGDANSNTINGGDGDDWLDSSAGADTFVGGLGWDTLTFWNAAAPNGLTVHLGINTQQNVGDIDGDTNNDFVTILNFQIEAMVGSTGNDVLNSNNNGNYIDGWEGDDVVHGGGGNDILVGGLGEDELHGFGGDDTFNAAFPDLQNLTSDLAADTYDGADTGETRGDTVSYADANAAVSVDLNLQGAAQDTGAGGLDTLIDIENLIGSAFNDTLTGDSQNNRLDGDAGNDTLDGGDGDDTLIGGAGNDSFKGGAGIDTLSYADANFNVTIRIDGFPSFGLPQDTGGSPSNPSDAAGVDAIIDDSIENIIGGSGDDNLTGSGGITSNKIYGGAGNDFLNGSGPDGDDDFLYGEAGDDFLTAGGLNNQNQGSDTLDGGVGFDTVSYFAATVGFTASLANQAQNTNSAAGDNYISIEALLGGQGNDHLIGDANTNTLRGAGGDDIIDGGAGIDTASWQEQNVSVTVDLRIAGAQNTGVGNDTLINIENLRGSAKADLLIGNAGDNRLQGQGGDDILIGGAGADQFDGGGGFDFISYRTATAAVVANLANSALNKGDAAGDIYVFDPILNGSSAEGLEGSQFVDTLIGDQYQNVLRGGMGADALNGGGGSDVADYRESMTGLTVSLSAPATNTGNAKGDTFISIEGVIGSEFADKLTGNAGNNRLDGQAGADVLDGGAGIDIAGYRFSSAGLTVDLGNSANNTGEAVGDVYISIEGLRGSNFVDTLRGDANSNILTGQGGADNLDGGGGIDFANYSFNNTGLTLNLADSTKNSKGSEAEGDIYTSIEGLWGSEGNDLLVGDDNDNVLIGGAGADVIQGGLGSDAVGYSQYFDREIAEGVTVNLGDTLKNTGDAKGDTYVSIENLQGSQYNDALFGDSSDNILVGLGGADYFDGGDGFDTVSYGYASAGMTIGLNGGAGDAAGDFWENVEYVLGTKFNDRIEAGNFGMVIDGGAGDDHISTFGAVMIGGVGADTLEGSIERDDTVSYQTSTGDLTINLGDASKNTGDAAGDKYISIDNAIGGAGNDVITGTVETLMLSGGAGDDHLIGVAAGMHFIGGAGADKMETSVSLPPSVASYETALVGVTAALSGQVANTGDAAGDTYVNIRDLIGSEFADELWGIAHPSLASSITGGNGDDVLHAGQAGSDLNGGEGADDLIGTATGLDIASYGDSNGITYTGTTGVTVDLSNTANNTGQAAGDTYTDIDGLSGTDFADRLVAADGDGYQLFGGGGNDTIIGKDTADVIFGEIGDDTLTGGGGNDLFRYRAPIEGGDTITDFISGQDAIIIDGNLNLLGVSTFGLTADAAGANGPAEWSGAKFLDSDYFAVDAADKAHAQFIFDTTDPNHHMLYFDADGTGAQSEVLIVDLLTANLTASNIGLHVLV